MMTAIKNVAIRTLDIKKCDAEKMVQILLKLPQSEREKLFYVMKGVELTVEHPEQRKAI